MQAKKLKGLPDFRDPTTGGAMVRAALWLASEIGEGGVFTSQELRKVVPGREEADRRVRDLRKYGWVIDHYRTGSDLKPDQRRLVKIGVHVWDKDARKAASVPYISAKIREEVFRRDGYACVSCGITPGEEFDHLPGVRARLTCGHIYPDAIGGKATADMLRAECQICNEYLQSHTSSRLDGDQVAVRAQSLSRADKARLMRRIVTNRREPDKVDEVWQAYKQLSGVERERLGAEIARMLGMSDTDQT